MALKRMDNVGIVVDDLRGTIDFFRELGLELEGRATIEGEWAGRVTGLGDQRVEIAMMRTPDGHGRLELSRFLTPPAVADHRNAPVNALGYLRVMFAVDDIDETLPTWAFFAILKASTRSRMSQMPTWGPEIKSAKSAFYVQVRENARCKKGPLREKENARLDAERFSQRFKF